MTTTTLFAQPPFDPRIRRLRYPLEGGTTPLTRGYMVWDKSVGFPTGYKKAATVRFLYNPSTISTTYVMQDSAAQAALNFPNAHDTASLAIPLQQQCEFSILFDRTYELIGTNSSSLVTDVQKLGCDVDVRAVRQFTGMYAGNYTTSGLTNKYATGVAGQLTQGIMQMVPAYLYFSTPNAGIMYYGYVDSWDVTYTHFTEKMIPMRCEVDMSFTFLPPPQSQTGGGTVSNSSIPPLAPGQSTAPIGSLPPPTASVSGR